jgi:hypothetical protein
MYNIYFGVFTYHSRFRRDISDIVPRRSRFIQKNYLTIKNTADVTVGKTIFI